MHPAITIAIGLIITTSIALAFIKWFPVFLCAPPPF